MSRLGSGLVVPINSAISATQPPVGGVVRRHFTREQGRGLEILGHAIEYLADEYAADDTPKGPLGNADPRVAAIQVLKALNRAIYYSGGGGAVACAEDPAVVGRGAVIVSRYAFRGQRSGT